MYIRFEHINLNPMRFYVQSSLLKLLKRLKRAYKKKYFNEKSIQGQPHAYMHNINSIEYFFEKEIVFIKTKTI